MGLLPLLTAALTAAVLLVSIYVLHKSRRIYQMTFALMAEIKRISTIHNVDLLRQIQALDGLYRDLGIQRSLPPTAGWAAAPDFLAVIAFHARTAQPDIVLECGSGCSTVVLARCMQLNGRGHVYSLDHDPDYAAQTAAQLMRHGLADWATVIHAPLTQTRIDGRDWQWYATDCVPPLTFDMIVIDGPPLPIQPLARYPAGPILFPRLAPNGIVFLDDTIRNDEREIIRRWREQFTHLREREYPCEKGCTSLRIP